MQIFADFFAICLKKHSHILRHLRKNKPRYRRLGVITAIGGNDTESQLFLYTQVLV